MRSRLASILHRWAYRIEGHRPEHRAGEPTSGIHFCTHSCEPRSGFHYGPAVGAIHESRGWN